MLDPSRPPDITMKSYLRLSPEHQQQLHALLARQFRAVAGHPGQLLTTLQCLVFAEEIDHQTIIKTTNSTLIKGSIEQSHTEPHYRSHTGPGENTQEHPKTAETVSTGAKLHGIEAAPSVELPKAGTGENTKDQQHCSWSQQKCHAISKVLVVVAGTLKGDHGENSFPAYSQQSHETVANCGFLIHEETQDTLEVIHDVGQ